MRLGIVGIVLVLPFLLGASFPDVAAQEKDQDWFARAIRGVELGDGVAMDQLILFPLVAVEEPATLSVSADSRTEGLAFWEPDFPARRDDVAVESQAKTPVLVFGGGVLVGGRLDRLIPRSFILPPGKSIEFEAFPAEDPRDRRKEGGPFLLQHAAGAALAPPFLRERAVFDPSKFMVPIFVSHFLEFRDEGDTRRSLAAIDSSAALGSFCEACLRSAAPFAEASEGRVVGLITVVRGRLQTLELFGSKALFRSYLDPLLRSQTYAAAAIELRARKVGMSVPGKDDQAKALTDARKRAESLLQELRGKIRFRKGRIPEDALGESLLFRIGQTEGQTIGLDGRLVHAVVFPENPFEEALFSRALKLPEETGDAEEAIGGLERREDRGNLSEYEKRLLDRMRQRRTR